MADRKSARFLVFLWVFFFFCLSFPASPAAALKLELASPPDELVTFEDLIPLKGVVVDAVELKINGITVDRGPDGSFAAGLVLKPGKNLVEVAACGEKGAEVKETRKILHLVAFPDLEQAVTKKGQKHWAREQIINLGTLGIIEAYPDNNFYPRNFLLRGEMATWLARAKQLPLRTPSQDVFYDVPKEHWRAPFVKAVVDAGYMQGFEKNLFWIDDGIPRNEVAEVVLKAEGGPLTGEATRIFEDVPLEAKNAFEICEVFRKGLVEGISAKKRIYDPDRFITRAEACMLLARDPEVNQRVAALFDFGSGYDKGAFCFVNTAPRVVGVKADPQVISREGKKVVTFTAEIVDHEGLGNLANVTIDLTGVNGPPDASMYDDGSNGDLKKEDGIYTLKIVAVPSRSGEVKFKVRAVDKYTFEGFGETRITVVE